MNSRSSRRQSKGAARAADVDVRRDWGAAIGEVVTLALLVVVPVVVNVRSENRNDIKDSALGLGVTLALFLWLLFGLRRGLLRWVASPLTPVVFAYVAWAALTLAFTHYHYAAIGEVGRLAAHVGLFFLALTYLRDLTQVRRLLAAACVAALPVCIYGFAQAAGKAAGDPTGRVFSFLGNATYLAGFLILLLPPTVAGLWTRSRVRPLFAVTVPLVLGCFYFTFSFGPAAGLLLGVLVALALLSLRGGRRTALTAAGGVAAAVLVLVPLGILTYRHMPPPQQERVRQVATLHDPTGGERQLHWRVALDLFREHPVTGVGYGVYHVVALERLSAPWYALSERYRGQMLLVGYAHNELLQALADAGLPGGVLLLALLALGLWSAGRVALRAPDPEWHRLGLALTVAFLAFIVQNQFGVTFRQTGVVTLFWLWLAVAAVGAARLGQEEPRLSTRRFRPLPLPAVGAAGAVAAGLFVLLTLSVVAPMQASAEVKLAKTLQAQNEWQAGAEAAEDAVARCPSSALGNYLAGNAWDALGDREKAIRYYTRSLQLQPGVGIIEYNTGYAYAQLRQYAQAEPRFRRAVALMPQAARHYAALAEVLAQEGKFTEAAALYRTAAEHNPGQAAEYLALSRTTARGQAPAPPQTAAAGADQQAAQAALARNDYGAAADACARWVQADPRNPDAYGSLGVSLFQLGRLAQAEQAFRAVLNLKPNDQQALYSLAITCGRQRKHDDEKRYLQQALKLDPDTNFGIKAKRRLAELAKAGG